MGYDSKQLGFNKEPIGLYHPSTERDNCGAGFICDLKGRKSNLIIHKALEILVRLTHRGAVSADAKTGDGAGILIKIPHEFFVHEAQQLGFALPNEGRYAVAQIFMPPNEEDSSYIVEYINRRTVDEGLRVLGWREVPTRSEILGEIARRTEPKVMQLFVTRGSRELTEREFNARIYVLRKRVENHVRGSDLCGRDYFYMPSFSTKTLVYKGLIQPEDIAEYFLDLKNPDLQTSLALVHQRFSTNTFPTWDLAHPFRYICHNGEINTLRGNINRMKARERLLESELFSKKDIEKITPIIVEGKSDSACLDNAVELMIHTGRSLPEVMMTLVPEAWERNPRMPAAKRAFYEWASCFMEPWDGPASIPFTDGTCIGAILDRNGLRPSRYTLTKDGLVIMASEVGVVDIDPENVEYHGRLEPGKMFLVDMEQGRIVGDEEIKARVVNAQPYRQWLDENLVYFSKLPVEKAHSPIESTSLLKRQQIFGFTDEDVQMIVLPMAESGMEPIGSMGTDTPLAVLSDKPRLLYDYFKQLFAQVTNPPLDGIREEIVTSVDLKVGSDCNIFDRGADHARKLCIETPVLTNKQLETLRRLDLPHLSSVTLPILFEERKGVRGMEWALDELTLQAVKAIDAGKTILIFSDRGANSELAPIPSLLAASHLHQALVRHGRRSKCGLIVESGDAREVHHFCTLFGFGVSAVNPYMVFDTIEQLLAEGEVKDLTLDKAIKNYIKAVDKGIIKVMNKMGVSTLNSYRGSQIFEAIGLKKDFVNRYFTKTITRIEGAGLEEITKDVLRRHKNAYPRTEIAGSVELEQGGEYAWRRNGERHLFNPFTVAKLQQAVRQSSFATFGEYSAYINDQSKRLMTLRGLMDFKAAAAIPLEEVEPWTDIVKRFKTGAMSYGSISQEAHENLALAMNRIGGKSNSGEGGEDEERYEKLPNGDWKRSAIKQVASGRFGVTSHYLTNASEIQIKMAQGAKPGEGGQLPGEKVYPWVAKTRNSTPWVGLISPPPHHDIYSIEDLAQLIYDLKSANRAARINVKLVSEVGVGTIAAGVAKAKADVILISGYDGGTGASPLTSLKHAGLPWELGIAEAQQTLVMNKLRSRVVLECDGQLKTGRDVAIACLLGAEEFGFATAPLVASGCIMMRVCHLNTCPVGVATQDPELRKKFSGKPEHVVNFMRFIAEELRQIMAQLGFRKLSDMVGRVDLLDARQALTHYKAKGLDLSPILRVPQAGPGVAISNTSQQEHGLENVLDVRLIEHCREAISSAKPVSWSGEIKNIDRTVGAMLSNEVSKIHGSKGLPEDTVKLSFYGPAGQSFGGFSTHGITMRVYGQTNDFLGKGLSGAKLIVRPPEKTSYVAEHNIITGNVALYGAISGQAFIRGIAGERFAVRNSGAEAVVEGVGDHGCEYMTGGRVIVLGRTGRNFAAGMSGGIAYVLDEEGDFEFRCNRDMVDLEKLEEAADLAELKRLLTAHRELTGSASATKILANFAAYQAKFVKVMPRDYRKALERLAKEAAVEAAAQSVSL